MINRPRSAPALELISRAESSVGVMYRSSGPNTGSNPGGGRILKKNQKVFSLYLNGIQMSVEQRKEIVIFLFAYHTYHITYFGFNISIYSLSSFIYLSLSLSLSLSLTLICLPLSFCLSLSLLFSFFSYLKLWFSIFICFYLFSFYVCLFLTRLSPSFLSKHSISTFSRRYCYLRLPLKIFSLSNFMTYTLKIRYAKSVTAIKFNVYVYFFKIEFNCPR